MRSIDDVEKEFMVYLACDAFLGTKSDYVRLFRKFNPRVHYANREVTDVQEDAKELIYEAIKCFKYPDRSKPGIPEEVIKEEEKFKSWERLYGRDQPRQ